MANRVDYVGHASVRIEIDGVRFLTDPVLRPRVAHLRRISAAAHPRTCSRASTWSSSRTPTWITSTSGRCVGLPPVRHGSSAPCPPAVRSLERGFEATPVAAGEAVSERSGSAARGRRRRPRRAPLASSQLGRFGGFRAAWIVGHRVLRRRHRPLRRDERHREHRSGSDPGRRLGPKLGAGHIGPRDAARVAAMVGPRVAVPIHWGTYRRMLMRVREPDDAPARALRRRARRGRALRTRVVLEPGEGMDLDV